ncbi:MAG: Hsp70 family protein [Synergistaceae bacterium]|nr:Hsp70 family protein [Synergistaceae bacterium]MBR0234626.1 Hsp70 family protein [Synergistaceae bacterium]
MSITDLNVCVGIDYGSKTSKISYDSEIISVNENFDALELREEAEIYFDEPVFSCVIAIPENFTYKQKDDTIFLSKKSGFKNVNIISKNEAINLYFNNFNYNGKILIYDFGASKSDILIFNDGEILGSEIIDDVSGNEFDKVFASWLSERFTLNLIDKKILIDKAEQIKISLSDNEYVLWRDVKILREDFERLIYFTIKRASHVLQKFMRIYKPDNFILTGGCAKIPIVQRVLREFTKFSPEIIDNIIAKGASIKAAEISNLSDKNKNPERLNLNSKIRELRGKLIEIEDSLTRKQKDKLYLIFKQAENISVSDPEVLVLIENLISEIKDSAK